MRTDRRADELRPITVHRGFTAAAPGSVLITAGRTTLLCTASVEIAVPPWMAGQGRGWITAEYGMLPGSTKPRKLRDRAGRVDGRTAEIQRLIGRSLRAVANLKVLGERTITVDCDVLEADGGTRTLGVTGAFIALVDAIESVRGDLPDPRGRALTDSVAAVSVGRIAGESWLDLCYAEDSSAEVDMNVVMTGSGRFIEVQGTGEKATFSDADLAEMLALARKGIERLGQLQRDALGTAWPFG